MMHPPELRNLVRLDRRDGLTFQQIADLRDIPVATAYNMACDIKRGKTKMSALIPPTVNNNGTSKQELVDGYINIMERLRLTLEEMRRNMPHGRDYQTVGQRVDIDAVKAYQQRIQLLQNMLAEFQEVAIAVDRQQGGRS